MSWLSARLRRAAGLFGCWCQLIVRGVGSWLRRLRTFLFQPVACHRVVGFCLAIWVYAGVTIFHHSNFCPPLSSTTSDFLLLIFSAIGIGPCGALKLGVIGAAWALSAPGATNPSPAVIGVANPIEICFVMPIFFSVVGSFLLRWSPFLYRPKASPQTKLMLTLLNCLGRRRMLLHSNAPDGVRATWPFAQLDFQSRNPCQKTIISTTQRRSRVHETRAGLKKSRNMCPRS